MTDPDKFADSRVVLIGVSAYEYAEFPPIRAARNSLQAMHALLTNPALCGWPPERITVIPNPISAVDLAVQLADLADNTAGVMVLYYVGHGVLTPRGELCLTVTSTRPDRPKITGLAWDTIADVLHMCPARVRIIILDCCFAGQAIESLAGDSGPGLADITHVEGVYTLTATTRNRSAHVPPPGQQDTERTSFTGALIDLVTSGIPDGPPDLTLGIIYPRLRLNLARRGLPLPNQRSTDCADKFVFAKNVAAQLEMPSNAAAEVVDRDASNTMNAKYSLAFVRPYIRWELYDDPTKLGAGFVIVFRNGSDKPIHAYIERLDVTINGISAPLYDSTVVRKIRVPPGQEREYRAPIIPDFPINGFFGTASYSVLYGPLDESVIYRHTHAFNFSIEGVKVTPQTIREGEAGSTFWTDTEEESDYDMPSGFTYPQVIGGPAAASA
jgi:Caspase domain